MVYYNLVANLSDDPEYTVPQPRIRNLSALESAPYSPKKQEILPIQPLDKRALYSCLQKVVSGEVYQGTDFHQMLVQKGAAMQDDLKQFHQWLEIQCPVIFTDEEVKALLEYIGLHKWGPIVVKDSTIIKKMFEVPTPLNYSSWNSNIDNMQIRSQFRNSLLLRREKGVRDPSSLAAFSPGSISKIPFSPVKSTGEKQKENAAINAAKLDQLRRKYSVPRQTDPSQSTAKLKSIKYPRLRKARGEKKSSNALASRPLPKLRIKPTEKRLSSEGLSCAKRCVVDGTNMLESLPSSSTHTKNEKRKRNSTGVVNGSCVNARIPCGRTTRKSCSLYYEPSTSLPDPAPRNEPCKEITDSNCSSPEPCSTQPSKSISMTIQIPRVKAI